MGELNFSLECAALSGAALVGFSGREAMSSCFEIDVFVSVNDASTLDAVLGTKLAVWFEEEPRYALAGVVAEVELVHELETQTLARLVVVPRLWMLGLSRHSRMFTNVDVSELLTAVLDQSGIDYELNLQGSYPKEEHICQYHESDLAFLSRWMEHEGIHYYFDHTDGVDKLVISDRTTHDSLGGSAIRYYPVSDSQGFGGSAFTRFSATKKRRASKVVVSDYDYAKPSVAVTGEQSIDGGAGEIVCFGDDRFFDPGRGSALAKVRAEALQAASSTHQASGAAFHLRSGFTFELAEHPLHALNKAYVCVALDHHANLAARTPELAALTGLDIDIVYRVSLDAIDAQTAFRPVVATSKPRVHGYISGTVDGASDSDYALLDGDGRYLIRMHFDESDLGDGEASTRLRMMQPHAGNPEGMHFPLRKGTEVMVAFLDGDPDRPIIAGAIPNAHNPSVVTADNHTHNVVHTGGDNRLDFEDQSGSQWITFSTPTANTFMHLGAPVDDRSHHIELHTGGNNLFDYGSNQDIRVGGVLEENITGPVEETYSSSQSSTVIGAQETTVDGATDETYGSTQMTLTVGQTTEDYQVPQDTAVNAAPRNEIFLGSQTTTVSGGGLTQQLTDTHTRSVFGATDSTHTSTYSRHVTGDVTQIFGGDVMRLWGPHTAEFESLNLLIPGGVTDVHVGYTWIVPNDTWCEPSLTYLANMEIKVGLLAYAAIGLKTTACGFQLAVTGFKYEATNFALGVHGCTINIEGCEGEGEATTNLHLAAFVILP